MNARASVDTGFLSSKLRAPMNTHSFQFERDSLQRLGIHCPALRAADACAFTMS